MIKYLLYFGILSISLFLTACSKGDTSYEGASNISATKDAPILETISAEEAKQMMEDNDEIIILDVRTEEEFALGHIKDALLIPDYELEERAEEQLKDKEATILVYCRSGRRSAQAAKTLNRLGYTSIYDFGGIIDWPYEVTTEE